MNRKLFMALGITMLCLTACNKQKETDNILLWLGSYCNQDEEGIRVYRFNQHTGDYTYLTGFSGLANPSFVWVARDGRHFYAVGEEDDPESSSANAFILNPDKPAIQRLSSQSNHAGAACNIILSPDERTLFTSSYGSGCVTEFPIYEDGSLGKDFVLKFTGHSVNPERQDHPYIHAVNFTPDGKYLLANDLGMDQIHVFKMRDRAATDSLPILSEGDQPMTPVGETYNVAVDPGAGPRHLAWSPNHKNAYLLSELSGQLFVLKYENEQLSVIQTLQADTLNAGGSADVHVSPDGKFVYASHRLEGDGITIWKVNTEDGTLSKVGFQPTGIHPRNFGITPNGELLLCACRDSNKVKIFRRNKETGLLTDTGRAIEMSRPTCVQFY
ncbi:MAG: lactonase family protein [Bacteroidales bacterium]|nr:lactonase family protein [Bacteroidales bacterium]